MRWGRTLVVALAVTSVIVVVGCGGSEPAATAPGVTASVYSSQYGYSFQFPTRCMLVKPTPKASDPGLAEQVFVADPAGMLLDGAALDVFSVAVYRLSPSAGQGDLKSHAAEFKRMAMGLAGRPSGLRVVADPAPSSVGGEPALDMEYFSGKDKARVGTVAYFVPKGDYAYWIRLQSSRVTKGSSTLVMALSTFKFE
jgi:hypothetical protein